MATTDAVNRVCQAMVHILRATMNTQIADLGFDTINPTFEVYSAKDFTDNNGQNHITSGASVFLFRVYPNLTQRTPPGRVFANGDRQRPRLPLDLHLIVTIWGNSADTQNRLVGWVTRTLEDYPVIPPSVLNLNSSREVFRDNESVELTIGEMESEQLLQMWDMLSNSEVEYHLCIPYIARAVYLDSQRLVGESEPVQVRALDMNRYDGAPS